MARPKRFSSDSFEYQLQKTIDELIEAKRHCPEAERLDIKVNDVAASFAVTCNTLRRWSIEYLGLPAKNYISLYRIEKAKLLLKAGHKPSVVSQKLGYYEHKTFSTVFKKVTKITPSDFVKIQ